MPLSDEQIRSLHNYFLARQDKIVQLTRALVEIESPSGDEEGSRAAVSVLVAEAQAIEGLRIERIAAPNYGEHLRITAFEDAPEASSIVILGHTDTVHPRDSLAQRPWRIEDGKAYGPGVFDMKGSCVVSLEVIRALRELQLRPKHPLILLLTCDEETGSHNGRALVEEAAKKARAVLVLEPPAAGGRVKTGRKGTGIFTIHAHGRAAHAGLEPEKGASAVLELARQTERLHALNDAGGAIRVTVGVFHGGTVSNVVPADAQIQIDVRFGTLEEAAYIEKQIRGVKPFDERVQLLVSGGINRPPLERTDQVTELYSLAEQVAEKLGYQLGEAQVGGASDGNFAAAAGATVLDGLGIEGDGAHAVHEHIVINNIPLRGALLAGLIASLA
ncbi:MAG TPA: M20 family metallopeptidase [Pyrinomonadaceae bacterium]|nr:M20 family metallopeptidase [Pyrinomonadaceae bacterium]